MTAQKRTTGMERLSDTAVRAWLRKPGTGSLHDGAGLYLRRRTEGAFWALRQVNPSTGKRTWAALFPDVPYPTATLSDARRKAAEARLRAADTPTDVVRDRQAVLKAHRADAEAKKLAESRRITVRDLFDRWASTELTPRIGTDGRRTGRKDGGQYAGEQFERRVFPVLGDTAAPGVTKADLLKILDAAKAEGKLRTANMLLADLKQMFRFALTRELVDRNPLDTVTKRDVGGADTERTRVLTTEEIKSLAIAIPAANMSKRSALAIWLILATGCRVGEAMGARWDDVDLTNRTWHLPVTKNERHHTIHLSAFAIKQMEALASLRGSYVDADEQDVPTPWIFPNAAAAGPVCVKSFGKQLADRQRMPQRRMQHRAKSTQSLALADGHWTAHDLRRTTATLMASLGISGDVIDECLNHVIESRVRRTYIRDRRTADQVIAFDTLGKHLTGLLNSGEPSQLTGCWRRPKTEPLLRVVPTQN